MNLKFFIIILILSFASFSALACEKQTISFSGDIKNGEAYQHAISNGLYLILTPQSHGWYMTIAPDPMTDMDYIYPVNDPYNFNQVQFLGGGFNRFQAPSGGYENISIPSQRSFLFLSDQKTYEKARLILANGLAEKLRKEEFSLPKKYLDALAALPHGRATIEMIDGKVIDPGPADQDKRQNLKSLKFTFNITLPAAGQTCN